MIRPAKTGDVDALCALGRETFSETFGYLYSSEDLSAYLEKTYNREAQLRALQDASIHHIVAQEKGALIGYAKAAPCALPIDTAGERAFELCRLYVRSSAQSHGTGTRLMENVLAHARERAFDTLYIGVWENNFRAQQFYARYGAIEVGEYRFAVGQQLDRELILRIAL